MKRLTLYILMAASAVSAFAAKDNRPNIILFLTDDQTRNSTGVYGNTQVKTPNMDKLANNGAIFANNYATTTICMASRASIFTGMYEYKTGCNFDKGALYESKWKKSYPMLLREAGYFTGMGGKVGVDIYDEANKVKYKGDKAIAKDDFDFFVGGTGQTEYETAKNKHLAKYAKEYPHSTRAYAAAIADFIKEAKASGKPFCFSMSFKAPHTPMKPDPMFNDVYKDTVWQRPANSGRESATHLSTQAKLGRQYLEYANAYFKDVNFQRSQTQYHQLIHGVDYAIGMVMETLEKEGVADNTILILTSDNGYSCSAHGMGGKVLAYEESAKTPLIIYDPRIKKANKPKDIWRTGVSANIDIAPTILDYAGVKIPENMDGKSLKKVVENPKEKVRKELALYQLWGSFPTVSLAIVTEDFKYIYYPYAERIDPAEELYNLKKDALEMTNVISDPEYKSTLRDMQAHYETHFQKYKKENVARDSYETFPVIFDKNISWDEKKKHIHKLFENGAYGYENMLYRMNYDGDIYDYDAVIEYSRKRLSGEIKVQNRSMTDKKKK
ncbi:MAG: sulfatase [Opitutales bacterium]